MKRRINSHESKTVTQANNLIKLASRIVAERIGLRTTENRTAMDRNGNKQS